MLPFPPRSLLSVLRALPAAVLAVTLLGGAPAQAATVTSATSPGPLTLTIGTTAPVPLVVGQPATIGLAITNTTAAPIGPFTFGVQASPSVKVSATFPGVHTCTHTGGNGFACDFLGQLQPGLTENAFSFTIVPQTAGPVDLTAFVQPVLGSSAPANSVDLVLNAVAPTVDLQLTQSASAGQPAAGGPLTYTFQVKHAGPQTALGTILADTLPGDEVALGATAGNGGACSVAGQAVSCSLGDIPAGSSVKVTVSALAPTLFGTYTNTGTVSSASVDANPANNSASATIQIR